MNFSTLNDIDFEFFFIEDITTKLDKYKFYLNDDTALFYYMRKLPIYSIVSEYSHQYGTFFIPTLNIKMKDIKSFIKDVKSIYGKNYNIKYEFIDEDNKSHDIFFLYLIDKSDKDEIHPIELKFKKEGEFEENKYQEHHCIFVENKSNLIEKYKNNLCNSIINLETKLDMVKSTNNEINSLDISNKYRDISDQTINIKRYSDALQYLFFNTNEFFNSAIESVINKYINVKV